MKINKVTERGNMLFIETDEGNRRVPKVMIKSKEDIYKLFEGKMLEVRRKDLEDQ